MNGGSLEKILVVKDLKKYFKLSMGTVKAVDGVSFDVNHGETFALVGESGSGKTTTGYLIMGIYAPSGGRIYFKGRDITLPASKRPKSVKRDLQIVFQDPGTSLNPAKYVRDIIALPLIVHKLVRDKRELEERVAKLLEAVELPPEEYMFRKPRDLGGGERQAVAIARALATNPTFIVLDEPTSALDVSIQAKILSLLLKLQRERKLSYLLITHDLSVVRNVASRVAVMYLGKIVEMGSTEDVFSDPAHPYSRMLLAAAPVILDEEEKVLPRDVIPVGEIPSAMNPPSGCRFHTRCPYVRDICRKSEPVLTELHEGHWAACHLVHRL